MNSTLFVLITSLCTHAETHREFSSSHDSV
uniref:Uncharacterized protein n=1 Tax=Arundo donax TaxID=35708 RepID=A0A0A9HNV5_ARUDO